MVRFETYVLKVKRQQRFQWFFCLAIRIARWKSLRTSGNSTRCEPRTSITDIQGQTYASLPPSSQADFRNEKISPKRKFSGWTSREHPGVIRADIPAQNFGQSGQNPGKNRHFGADIHDPKARTSTTLRISKNFGQKNFGLNFRSLRLGEAMAFLTKWRSLLIDNNQLLA